MSSIADQFRAELGPGSITDLEYARLLAKTGLSYASHVSMMDLYRIAGETPRLPLGRYLSTGPTLPATFKGESLVAGLTHTWNGIPLNTAPSASRIVFIVVGTPTENARIPSTASVLINGVAINTSSNGSIHSGFSAGVLSSVAVIRQYVAAGTTFDLSITFDLAPSVDDVNIMVFDFDADVSTVTSLQSFQWFTDNTAQTFNFSFEANQILVAVSFDAILNVIPAINEVGVPDFNDVSGFRLAAAVKVDEDTIPPVVTTNWPVATTARLFNEAVLYTR